MLDLPKELRDAVKTAEETLGVEVPENLILDVLIYARRKLDGIKQRYPEYTDDYLPILFENEIRDCYTRGYINTASEIMRGARA